MTDLQQQIKTACAEAARAEQAYSRLQRRREEIMARKVRDEARRGRFVRRLDDDIADAHKRLLLAEANLEELIGAAGE